MSSSAPVEVDLFDHEAVRALLAYKDQLLAEKQAALIRKDAAIAVRDEKLSSREQQIEHLKLLLEKMRRDAYGAKSE